MSTLAESFGEIRKPWQWMVIGGVVLLIWCAVALPTFQRARPGTMPQIERGVPVAGLLAPPQSVAQFSAPRLQVSDSMKAEAVTAPLPAHDAAAERRIIRTGSLEMVVQHPSEVADKIAALAQSMGGYLVSANGGGDDAASSTLTIRVPSARFEDVRAAIRKLGLRVESEKIDAQDVTRQYVDEDASIRNLKAEEAQYLAILKQAGTVKDLLAVSERLSEVRGQIEQQQAEFNALSGQIETVALSVSLKTEKEAQTFGLNWRPGYQIKVALRDGLESVADYATAMMTILFYLPATLLWVGTIVVATVGGWRLIRWVRRRWLRAVAQ
jgi:hypothetical protein